MASLDRYQGFPAIAGSPIAAGQAVKLATGSPGTRVVIPVTAVTDECFGFAKQGAAATTGAAVALDQAGAIVECLAAASLGAGAGIGFASTNNTVGPLAAASGVNRQQFGKALQAAADGEYFEVFVNPKQLSDGGLIL